MYLKEELYRLIQTDESIFDFIQNSSLDGLWYWDLENMENEWMSAKFWTVLGYNSDEMPHKSAAWQGIINEDDLKLASENFTRHCDNPNYPYDQIVRYRHKNGSTKWIRCRGLAIRDNTGKPIRMLGAHQDVTELKRIEHDLYEANEKSRESEEKYRAFYNKAPLSYQSLDENGCFIDINPMWEKTLGYERSEVIGKWYGDFLHPDYVEHFRVNFPAFKKRGYVSDVQFKLRRKDNTFIYVSFEGCVGYTPEGKFKQTYCVFKDITEQKAVENALIKAKEKAEESEENLSVTLLSIGDGVITTNKFGIIDRMNKVALKLCGWHEDEIIGKPLTEVFNLIDAFTREPVHNPVEKVIENGETVGLANHTILVSKDGKEYHIADSAAPIKDKDGNIKGVVLVFSDVSDKFAAEEEIRFQAHITANSPVITAFHDKELNMVWANNAYQKATGLSLEEIKGKKCYQVWNLSKPCRGCPVITAIETGENAAYELTPDNQEHWPETQGYWLSQATPVRDAQGEITGAIEFAIDITERKQAELKLAESEERFKSLHNASFGGIAIHDKGIILECNQGLSEMTGYSLDELIGMDGLLLIAPDHREMVMNNIITGYEKPYEANGLRKNGAQFPMRLEARTVPYKGKNVRSVEFRDITERKHAEEELRKLSQAVEQSPAVVIITNPKGIIEYVNAKFTDITGYTAEEAIGQNPRILKSGEQSADFYKELWKTISSGKEWNGELRNKKKSGELFWESAQISPIFNEKREIINYLGIKEDVTELKQAEKNFRHSIDESPLGIRVVNQKGKPVYVNQAFLKIYDFTSFDEYVNTPAIERYTNESYKEHLERKIIRKEGKEVDDYEISIRRSNGDIRHIKIWRKEVIWNKEKHFQVINQDITENKTLYNQLLFAKEKAEESDRLKSAFLANMSHEIRTPMNGILGFADLLKEPDLSSDKQHEYIKIIEQSGARMLNTINDIIDISKIEAGLMKLDMKETNINEQIEFVYAFFKPEAENKGIEFSFSSTLPQKEATIKTDSEKVYAILTNLVKNAFKYTEKGSIKLGCDLVKTDNNVSLLFFVKDTGIGIPKDRQEAIFERFIHADVADKMAYQGAGLGLAITKTYVEMLGGRIWVESEAGKGSAFYFTLPYITNPVAETTDQQLATQEKNNDFRKLKILVAEDDVASEMLILAFIKSFGKEFLKARTGVEAVDVCRTNPDTDLILMDIRMPEMNGYEATKQIRTFNKDVVIIAQTAFGMEGDRQKSIDAGCNDYIAKPINKIKLQALIQQYFKK